MALRSHILLAPLAFATLSLGFSDTLLARTADFDPVNSAQSGQELPPYLQCVPFAREVSGVEIYGDAHTWWAQAAGRYERGTAPRVGAVMAFVPYRGMQLGHVAVVSQMIDSRTVMLDHANWSPINGRRGQIERGVRAIDVSPDNDWSQVRVWYHPLQGLGTTAWPVRGFIYPDGAPKSRPSQRFAQTAPQPSRDGPSKAFLAAFGGSPEPRAPARVAYQAPQRSYETARPLQPRQQPVRAQRPRRTNDIAARAVALYD